MNPKQVDQQDYTRLRGFGAAHHLKIRTFTVEGEEQDAVKGRVICFGVRAAICELGDIPRLLGVTDGWSAKQEWLKRYDGEKRLCLSIWPPHVDYLNGKIGFDAYQRNPFDRHSALPTETTTWGGVLSSFGIEYLTESENGIAFTFPTEDEPAVKLVLALGAAKVALNDLGVISESLPRASSGQGLSGLMAQAAVVLRSANRSKSGYQRLRL